MSCNHEALEKVDSIIDFRRSLPPPLPMLHRLLATAVRDVTAVNDLGALHRQTIPGGSQADRDAGARWLAPRLGEAIQSSRLWLTNGTQSAVLLLLRGIVGAGNLLAAEEFSYGALRRLSELAGVRLRGVDIDSQGIMPESFEALCRSDRPKALYCNPTVQNPTTAIMPRERRIALAQIARQYGVAIIEDDPLGRLHPGASMPIAALASDVTWYVMGMTKCLSHGLRLAYLVVPSAQEAARVLGPVEQLSYWHPAPLMSALATQLVNSGAAASIAENLMQECAVRETAARKLLSGCRLHSQPGSMHVWLELPKHWTGPAFAEAAAREGVLLRSAELFAVDDRPAPSCVRLSLSAPATLSDVQRGLETLSPLIVRH